MNQNIETIYILENPEKNITQFATGYQLRYDDIIKDVFGVACMNDVHMMIQFNKSFQESICKRDHIHENNLSIDRVIRVATKNELLQLRDQLMGEQGNSANIPCPFDAVIKLQDGIFKWDENNSSYISISA
nr:hypothetical protein [Neobacillus sp. Marseille-Q6967]